jgi:hypothetical protein
MNRTEAVHVLEDAITSIEGLAEITTTPTAEQFEAMNSVRADDIAPGHVCDAMDLEQGSTWGEIVAEIREDVETA